MILPEAFLAPSAAMLTGGGVLLARDYLRYRLRGFEDRFMERFSDGDWAGNNMDLIARVPPGQGPAFKAAMLERVERLLAAGAPDLRLLREHGTFDDGQLRIVEDEQVSLQALCEPRHGLYFDLTHDDEVRIVWNHMHTDGVGMWTAIRRLFDENPPLIPYRDVPVPPPVIPELIALPSVARRLAWRGSLRREIVAERPTRGFEVWEAAPLRALKEDLGVPFNLVASAQAVAKVFDAHPDRRALIVGLTAYFPFLEGRNKYGIFLCKVRRRGGGPADVGRIARTLARQTNRPMVSWGTSAAQSYALGRMPDKVFERLITFFRQQVDVLVSSLPVGQRPITLAEMPARIACHPWYLTLPYYFLLVGTRDELHVSRTSRLERMAEADPAADAWPLGPEPPTSG